MARLAKLVLLLFTLLGAVYFLFAVPFGCIILLKQFPEWQSYALAWAVFTEVMVIPAAVALFGAWNVVRAIGKPQRPVRSFRRTAAAAAAGAVCFCGGAALLYALGYFHPAVYPVGIPAAFFGVAVVGVAFLLALGALKAED